MINEEKIIIMNKLAMFDDINGKTFLRISKYPKKTYLSTNRLISFITYSLGYFILVLLISLSIGEKTFNKFSYESIIAIIIFVIILYVVFLIINILYTNKKCKQMHYKATMETKNYYKNIKKLMRMYSNDNKSVLNDEGLQDLYELLGDKNERKL